LVITEALAGGSFIVKVEKQDDRNNPPGETLQQKKEQIPGNEQVFQQCPVK
jgi:hypothetical protein